MSAGAAPHALQQRLAERLQTARAPSQRPSWLAVECAGLGVLLPLGQTSEIFNPPPLTSVPHTQAWLLGVANLRGGLCSVVDLGGFMGLRQRPAALEGGRLVALHDSLNLPVTLWVDRLLGLRSDEQVPVEVPVTAPRPVFAPGEREDGQGRRWLVLDLERLSRFPPFLAVSAHRRPD